MRSHRLRGRSGKTEGVCQGLRHKVRAKRFSTLRDVPVHRTAEVNITEDYVARLKKAVVEYDMEGMPALAKEALDHGMDPVQGIEKGLGAGIREVGQKFGAGECFLPELVMAAETMRTGVAKIGRAHV
jgi:methanogenic corrinoid protein MtbC1